MLNYDPISYMKIDMANFRGLDQEQFEDRIAWVNRIEADDTVSLEDYVDQADKPYQFMASVMAYRDALAGKPTGYMVGLDAAASGFAIMGAVVGCKVTCANTGLTGTVRKDMYSECTKEMNRLLGTKKAYDRKTVKYVQMP